MNDAHFQIAFSVLHALRALYTPTAGDNKYSNEVDMRIADIRVMVFAGPLTDCWHCMVWGPGAAQAVACGESDNMLDAIARCHRALTAAHKATPEYIAAEAEVAVNDLPPRSMFTEGDTVASRDPDDEGITGKVVAVSYRTKSVKVEWSNGNTIWCDTKDLRAADVCSCGELLRGNVRTCRDCAEQQCP